MARGLSVLFLAIIHTLWMYGSMETQHSWLGQIVHFVGKGTGMFLLTMGFSFTLSRNNSLKLSVKRAFYVLGLGYFMNFMKFVAPILGGFESSVFIEQYTSAYGWTLPLTASNLLFMLSTGDILQMAGVALLLMGLIHHFFRNQKFAPLIAAFVIIAVSPFVHGFRVGIVGLDYILDLLWGAEWNVYFAVFPWSAFILIGMFFGYWYQEKRDFEHVAKMMLYIGIVFFAFGGGLCMYDFDYHFKDFFHLGPGGVVYLAGFNLIMISLSRYLVKFITNDRLKDFIYYCSKRVTSFYIIQWSLICWGLGIIGYQQYDIPGTLGLMLFFVLLSFGCQYLWDIVVSLRKPKTNLRVAQ
ncbi:hypothetical protein AUTU_12850 [Aureibacter tunicatorum]|nr:hypothetical protein AUTU_12850 [Aureibacter tunicatorum]